MKWLALDIGGANIKVADGIEYARAYPFALWREPSQLAQQIRAAIADAPPTDQIAVTMTGELADCFESKAAGVRLILGAVHAASDSRRILVYLVDGGLVSPELAMTVPHLTAASNWHALARFAGRYAPAEHALLVDVGSTTCDVVPLVDGIPKGRGTTDTQRLLAGELVYTGVERSPICGVLSKAPYRGQTCPIVNELFATMRDAYLILDRFRDAPGDTLTADGKPATRQCALARLARTVAGDAEEFNHADGLALAKAAAAAQVLLLSDAIRKVTNGLPGPPHFVILSGHGEFLARDALELARVSATTVSLTNELGPVMSRCAPAYALAVLAAEAARD